MIPPLISPFREDQKKQMQLPARVTKETQYQLMTMDLQRNSASADE